MQMWELKPAKCECTRMVVETIQETLDCPLRWRWVEEIKRWVHE